MFQESRGILKKILCILGVFLLSFAITNAVQEADTGVDYSQLSDVQLADMAKATPQDGIAHHWQNFLDTFRDKKTV